MEDVLFVVSQSSPTEIKRSREIHDQKQNVAAIVVFILSLLLQYNTPGDPADYVHRVGRTARIGLKGNALLFLTPAEVRENDHIKSWFLWVPLSSNNIHCVVTL